MNSVFRCSKLHWTSAPATNFQPHPSGKAALLCWAWKSPQSPAGSRQSQQLGLGTLFSSGSKPQILEQLQTRRAGHGSPENRQTLCRVGLFKPPKEQFGSSIRSAHKTLTPNKTWMQGWLQMEVAVWSHLHPRPYKFSSTFVWLKKFWSDFCRLENCSNWKTWESLRLFPHFSFLSSCKRLLGQKLDRLCVDTNVISQCSSVTRFQNLMEGKTWFSSSVLTPSLIWQSTRQREIFPKGNTSPRSGWLEILLPSPAAVQFGNCW